MTIENSTPDPSARQAPRAAIPPSRIVGAILVVFSTPLILFLCAGTVRWWQGWVFSVIVVVGMVGGRLVALRVHPDLIEERAHSGEYANTKEWDRKLAPWVGLYGPLLIVVVSGLDRRFGWTPPLPLWVTLTGLALLLAGYLLANWAFYTNRFFSANVRIQTERGHTVVEHGPYALVRHPGYAGGLLAWLATPLFLGALWAYVPVFGVSALVIYRTRMEDQTLLAELPGYADYARRTRFRLLPGVW